MDFRDLEQRGRARGYNAYSLVALKTFQTVIAPC